MTSPLENPEERWYEAQHHANYWKALTGVVNRLKKEAEDLEKFGYEVSISIVSAGSGQDLPYRILLESQKYKTVEQLSNEGWAMILTPPPNYTGG